MGLLEIIGILACIIAIVVVYAMFCASVVIWFDDMFRYLAYKQQEDDEEKDSKR